MNNIKYPLVISAFQQQSDLLMHFYFPKIKIDNVNYKSCDVKQFIGNDLYNKICENSGVNNLDKYNIYRSQPIIYL